MVRIRPVARRGIARAASPLCSRSRALGRGAFRSRVASRSRVPSRSRPRCGTGTRVRSGVHRRHVVEHGFGSGRDRGELVEIVRGGIRERPSALRRPTGTCRRTTLTTGTTLAATDRSTRPTVTNRRTILTSSPSSRTDRLGGGLRNSLHRSLRHRPTRSGGGHADPALHPLDAAEHGVAAAGGGGQEDAGADELELEPRRGRP